MENETNPCQSHNVAQKCAVWVLAARIEITNFSMQKTQCDCELLFLCVGLLFYDE